MIPVIISPSSSFGNPFMWYYLEEERTSTDAD
jgi:hypothetical protein